MESQYYVAIIVLILVLMLFKYNQERYAGRHAPLSPHRPRYVTVPSRTEDTQFGCHIEREPLQKEGFSVRYRNWERVPPCDEIPDCKDYFKLLSFMGPFDKCMFTTENGCRIPILAKDIPYDRSYNMSPVFPNNL